MWIYDSNLCFKEIWGFVEIWSFGGAGFDLYCQFRAGPVDRPVDRAVDRSRDQSTDLALFPVLMLVCLLVFPVCFIGFPRCFPALCLTCFTPGVWGMISWPSSGLVEHPCLNSCILLLCSWGHMHPLRRGPPRQGCARCIASSIHPVRLSHYDFKALADPACNV